MFNNYILKIPKSDYKMYMYRLTCHVSIVLNGTTSYMIFFKNGFTTTNGSVIKILGNCISENLILTGTTTLSAFKKKVDIT